MKKRVTIGILLLATVVTMFTGCKKKTVEVEPTETQKKEPVVVETEKKDPHEGLAQSILTGEWVDPELANRQIVALMIENTHETCPQYFINHADVYYELPVEGGITRIMGIYQDYEGAEKFGNVRSCRYSFLYFAREYDAVYLHCGTNALADNIIASGFVYDVDAITGKGGNYFYRENNEPGRSAPHNLYTSSELVKQAIVDYGYPTTKGADVTGPFTFAEEGSKNILANGTTAKAIDLYYVINDPYFLYDDATEQYTRCQFGEEQIDGLTGEAVKVKNIIVQNASLSFFDDGVLNFYPVAEGTGKYFTQGKYIDITWKKDSETSPTKYYDTLGNEIKLNPGKTWVCVQNIGDAEKNLYYDTVEAFQNR